MANIDKTHKHAIARWEFAGFIFINIIGSLMHFVFDWFGRCRPLALIAAVNESTWEHLKLAFWPALIFSLIEYKYLRMKARNFFLAKTLSFYTVPVFIAFLFYVYMWVIGHDVLFLDILIFVVAVGVGQLVSYMLLTTKQLTISSAKSVAIFLAILILTFLLFTFFPPHVFLFKDPVTGGYGIID